MAVDLRSDLLSLPSPAIMEALVAALSLPGEFEWRAEPAERRLEERVAQMLGKEAAVLMPSCTAANLAALKALAPESGTITAEVESHLATNEAAGVRDFLGYRLEAYRDDGRPPEEIVAATPVTGVFCVENTHNRYGGRPLSVAHMQGLAKAAHARGEAVFLDGARLWNAAIALGCPVKDLAQPADLVTVSFNKGLGAPLGAALAGPRALVDHAYERYQKIGACLRPSGFIVAAALAALDGMASLAQDHARAKALHSAISGMGAYGVLPYAGTNIILMQADSIGLSPTGLVAALERRAIRVMPFGQGWVRMVLSRNIGERDVSLVLDALREIAAGA